MYQYRFYESIDFFLRCSDGKIDLNSTLVLQLLGKISDLTVDIVADSFGLSIALRTVSLSTIWAPHSIMLIPAEPVRQRVPFWNLFGPKWLG
jgi:hypothetical protein